MSHVRIGVVRDIRDRVAAGGEEFVLGEPGFEDVQLVLCARDPVGPRFGLLLVSAAPLPEARRRDARLDPVLLEEEPLVGVGAVDRVVGKVLRYCVPSAR
jgi:hypothetical protein